LKKISLPSVDANVFIATAAALLGQHINSCSRLIHTPAIPKNLFHFLSIASDSGVENTSTQTAPVNSKLRHHRRRQQIQKLSERLGVNC